MSSVVSLLWSGNGEPVVVSNSELATASIGVISM